MFDIATQAPSTLDTNTLMIMSKAEDNLPLFLINDQCDVYAEHATMHVL